MNGLKESIFQKSIARIACSEFGLFEAQRVNLQFMSAGIRSDLVEATER
jgi:hypothetical protein